MRPADPSRRVLIAQLGLAGAALAAWPVASLGVPPSWLDPDEEVIPFTDVPSTFRPHPHGEAHFAISHGRIPALEVERWRLEIDGLAGPPMSLTLADLERRPRVECTAAFECGGNSAAALQGLVGQATWTGVSLQELLRDLRAPADARVAVFLGADAPRIDGTGWAAPFSRSLALDEAMKPDAILAYGMNGRALPASHGFPLRLIVPGWYGVANVKWLTRIELRRARRPEVPPSAAPAMDRRAGARLVCAAPWVPRQRVKSVIARVTRGGDGRVTSRGVAWSDGTPLARVDVQIDGGAWQPAILETPASRFAWTCFWVRSDLGPGDHRIVSRATDCAGRTQPTHLDLRRTYWEDCAQFTRTIRVPPRRA